MKTINTMFGDYRAAIIEELLNTRKSRRGATDGAPTAFATNARAIQSRFNEKLNGLERNGTDSFVVNSVRSQLSQYTDEIIAAVEAGGDIDCGTIQFGDAA